LSRFGAAYLVRFRRAPFKSISYKAVAGLSHTDGTVPEYDAWRAIAETSQWRTPQDVKKSHPKASILKAGRVVFNIKANDYRLITLVHYESGIVMIRFFGTHREYDEIDAETV
jgi:mRNA interferase HigB